MKFLSIFTVFKANVLLLNMIKMKLMQQYWTLIVFLICGLGFSQEMDTQEIFNEKDTLIQKDAIAMNKVIDTIKIDTTLIEGQQIAIIDHAEASEFDKKWLVLK